MIGGYIGKPIGGVINADATPIPSADSWFHQLETPPRIGLTKAAHAAAQIASGVTVDPYILTQSEAVTIDRWQQPFSEPQRFRQGLAARHQQDFIYTHPWVIPIDRWQQPLSEPRRDAFERHLPIGLYPYEFFVKAEPFAEDVTLAAWWRQLCEPSLFLRKPFFTGEHQSHIQFLLAVSANVDRIRLHGRHDETIDLAAKHDGTVQLHAIPKGDLPEAI